MNHIHLSEVNLAYYVIAVKTCGICQMSLEFQCGDGECIYKKRIIEYYIKNK